MLDTVRGLRPAMALATDEPDRFTWQQRVGSLRVVPALIRELGADPVRVLADAGLAAHDLDDLEGRIPFAKSCRVLYEAARQTRTPHFGLIAGRAWHLGEFGHLGAMIRHSSTLREALETLVLHQHQASDGGLAFLLERHGVVEIGYAIYHGGVVGAAEFYDAALVAGVNYVRELCGAGWDPTEVLIPHSAPPDARMYRNLFHVQPRFDSEYAALRFPASWMERPVIGADRELRRLAADVLGKATPTLLQKVYRTIRVQLLTGHCSGDTVATGLALHRRTLNRRLQEQGTTFQHCLDQVRFEVACQLLATSHVSLDDVAATLGYASVSPFMRTFRRWSGTTPAQWRRVFGHEACGARIDPLA
jgi:AraC-like DNA-binding protein